jgi:ABC-type Zn2+ transport system substrate-binding protein/surface adhesin
MSDINGHEHLHLHVHFDDVLRIDLTDGEQTARRRHEEIVALIKSLGAQIMATLADLQAQVAKEDTVIDSAITLLQGLAAQVAALTPNQAAIDALAADIGAKTDALAAAVTANTPAAP